MDRRQFLFLSSSILLLAACGGKTKYQKLSAGSKVLALGDSLTAGYGAAAGEDYPSQLAKITAWEVLNAGVSGDTSEQALVRLPEWLEQQPQLVLLSIGGNDFLRRLPESETRKHISQMIGMLQDKQIPVVLVAIPYFTTGALMGRISEHPLYADLARQYRVPLLSGVWADVLSKQEMKSDAVHANAIGYRYFAEKMADFLKQQGFR